MRSRLPDLAPGDATSGNVGYRFDVTAINAVGTSPSGSSPAPFPLAFNGGGVALPPPAAADLRTVETDADHRHPDPQHHAPTSRWRSPATSRCRWVASPSPTPTTTTSRSTAASWPVRSTLSTPVPWSERRGLAPDRLQERHRPPAQGEDRRDRPQHHCHRDRAGQRGRRQDQDQLVGDPVAQRGACRASTVIGRRAADESETGSLQSARAEAPGGAAVSRDGDEPRRRAARRQRPRGDPPRGRPTRDGRARAGRRCRSGRARSTARLHERTGAGAAPAPARRALPRSARRRRRPGTRADRVGRVGRLHARVPRRVRAGGPGRRASSPATRATATA